jgi:ATP-dependent helicase/DNAse subunit B
MSQLDDIIALKSDREASMTLRLSYSSISTYEKCPFQYFLQYVERLEMPRSPALSFGSSLHGALERFHSGRGKAIAGSGGPLAGPGGCLGERGL